MAKQRGALTLEGSLGNITFYKSKHGYLAKEKSIISGERQAVDPAYQRTRENNEEFGKASRASKLLRGMCSGFSVSMVDDRLRARLMKSLVAIIRMDIVNQRGKRIIQDEHAVLLEGFDFNVNASLNMVLQAPFRVEMDRGMGAVSLTIPSFDPQEMLNRPKGATHSRLVMGGATVDFIGQQHSTVKNSSGYLSYNAETGMQQFGVRLPAGSAHPVFVAFGVEFYQEVNRGYYSLKDGEYNSLAIVKVG